MGLDISHNAWSGNFGSFGNWRREIAYLAGFPPLDLMEGFYIKEISTTDPFLLLEYKFPNSDELCMLALRRIKKQLPIKWDLFKKHPLTELLNHSDCDGHISWRKLNKIINELEKLIPLMAMDEEWIKQKTEQFIIGAKDAFSKKENLKFR